MGSAVEDRCVLVVDDDAVLRRVVRAVLEADGFRVLEAHDGEHGLKLAASERPSVVILDVMMPGSTASRSAAGSTTSRPRS
jgi:DNA-binding response OmpR family regulator